MLTVERIAMKRTSLYTVSTVLIVLLILLIIPFKRQKKYEVKVACATDAVTRLMANTKEWHKWWPGRMLSDSSYELANNNYQIQTVLLNGFYAVSEDKKTAIEVQFIPDLDNHTKFTVFATQVYSSNPLKRIQQLFSNSVQQSGKKMMLTIEAFFNSTQNVYGFNIEKTKVQLLNWMSAKKIFTQEPSTTEVYTVIEGLNNYILSQSGQVIGEPIMHIRMLDNNQFELMTALPVTQPVKPSEQYSIKQMVPGFMLIGQVKGGPSTVKAAAASLENYVRDYRKQSPAIPFQTLITDRRNEADTIKWITQLNFPVFN